MSANEQDIQALQRACLGNPEAMQFLVVWREYVHRIDDLVDCQMPSYETKAEELLKTFAIAIRLYSHPFYLRNLAALRQVALNVTNAYADSVAFEREDGWKREWSDHNRHAGAEMVLAVAGICAELSGHDAYQHMRSFSEELRVICYCEHHDRNGKAN